MLWREFFYDLMAGNPPDSWWSVPFNPAEPLTTPNGVNGADPGVQAALADAVQFFQAHHIPLGATLGDTQHYAGIPIPGCTDGEGCFAVVEPGTPVLSASGSYPGITGGSSFIMAVELTRHGPQARTILTYSESANPASPHYRDQTELFSRKQWVTERFTQAQITADPTVATTVLHG